MTKNKIRIVHTGDNGNTGVKFFDIQYSLSFGLHWHTYYDENTWQYLTKKAAIEKMDKIKLPDILEFQKKIKEEKRLRNVRWIEESNRKAMEEMTITKPLI